MEIYDLHDKDLKIIILKKLNEMPENRIDNRMKSGKQHMNKMRSLVEKNRNHKKKEQTEILELKNTMKKMEEVNRFNNRLHHIARKNQQTQRYLN